MSCCTRALATLRFIKFNNFGTQHLNGPRRLFLSFCCTTRRIFEPLHVFEPGFNMDKYGILINILSCYQMLRKTSLFLISLLMLASHFRMLLQSIVYSVFVCVFPHQDALMSFTIPVSE